ncbi:alpha-N-acetylgalactosaminide alpha-2,6-sialyltransferase 5 isoform X1 [Patagioenas fasciata]|uniref:alpha-N-acetylgalactosaminide alpha-2,6-sialyltransferase 5 isoform X1 n=1 Tax=Patagioenas fasciata TaxID=372321 RepID=UPI003A99612F
MPSLAGSGRTGGREAHKMKTLMRHGLAVCLALTTMCTSLLLMYGGIGGGGGHPEPRRQQQQQVAAVPSRPPERDQHHPALPVGAGLLEGYISVLEHKPLKMHCKSCALVTSSGHLLGSKQGDRIDETECVIRMNDAPTRGYGKDVGNKTSVRVIAHSSIQRILRNRNELLNMSHGAVFIFWGPSSYMRRDGKGLVYNNLQLMNQILPQLKAYMISRHKMLQFDDLFKRETGKDRKISNTWLSTGWFTMTIALELCDRINVYGMVPPDFCSAQGCNPSLSWSKPAFPLRAPRCAQDSLLNWDVEDFPLASLGQQPGWGAQMTAPQFPTALQCCCCSAWLLSSLAGKDAEQH